MPACGLPSALSAQPDFHGDIVKFSVVLVLVERAGGGIVRDVNVRPAVVVEIGGEHAEAVSAVGFEQSGCFAYIRERSVAVVVIENFFPPFSPGGPHATITPL